MSCTLPTEESTYEIHGVERADDYQYLGNGLSRVIIYVSVAFRINGQLSGINYSKFKYSGLDSYFMHRSGTRSGIIGRSTLMYVIEVNLGIHECFHI